ncbi:MAG: hypothetical protein IJP57_02670, partial [Firmicutes bacterium]|nr:hypothetical protein [Bacillota bacterium]
MTAHYIALAQSDPQKYQTIRGKIAVSIETWANEKTKQIRKGVCTKRKRLVCADRQGERSDPGRCKKSEVNDRRRYRRGHRCTPDRR